eukprot:13950088-Alexandrium_andersonii.AAC.1
MFAPIQNDLDTFTDTETDLDITQPGHHISQVDASAWTPGELEKQTSRDRRFVLGRRCVDLRCQ